MKKSGYCYSNPAEKTLIHGKLRGYFITEILLQRFSLKNYRIFKFTTSHDDKKSRYISSEGRISR